MSLEQAAAVAGAIVAGAVWLRWDVHRHPSVKCGRCGGSGKHWNVIHTRYGQCRRCKGSGKRRGILPRMFGAKGD